MTALSRRQVLAALPLSAAIAAVPKGQALAKSLNGNLPRVFDIDKIAEKYISGSVPGLSVSVTHNGVPVHCAGYGIANVEHNALTHADTLFQTGSVGKMFTAILVLLLHRDGRLDIDAPLTRYFSDSVKNYKKVTARHLLNHISGITNYDEIIPINRDFTDDELLNEFYKLGFDFEPGKKWDYCNTGYALLGLLATRVGGKHYGELLAERIFKPAGMKTARVIAPESDIVPNRAAGYNPTEKGELKNQWYASDTFLKTGDGAIYVSARDMMMWGLALRNNKILTADEYALLTKQTPQSIAAENEVGGYGMGMSISKSGAYSIHSHGGSWQGFLSSFMRVLEADLVVSANANSSDGQPGRLAYEVAQLFVPGLPEYKNS